VETKRIIYKVPFVVCRIKSIIIYKKKIFA